MRISDLSSDVCSSDLWIIYSFCFVCVLIWPWVSPFGASCESSPVGRFRSLLDQRKVTKRKNTLALRCCCAAVPCDARREGRDRNSRCCAALRHSAASSLPVCASRRFAKGPGIKSNSPALCAALSLTLSRERERE